MNPHVEKLYWKNQDKLDTVTINKFPKGKFYLIKSNQGNLCPAILNKFLKDLFYYLKPERGKTT